MGALASARTLAAGTNQAYAVQFNGTAYPTAGDTCALTATAGGKTTTLTGHF